MKAIIVDDEAIMLRKFQRISRNIQDIELIGCFEEPKEAIRIAEEEPVDLAFLDIEMPIMNGIELARRLREIRPDILIVFLTAYDEYIRDSNEIGADYYLVKPYTLRSLELAMERVRLLKRRQRKDLYIQTFGRFTVMRGDTVLPLTGKAKEILALVVTRRGKEISNQEIYHTIWEGRPSGNREMTVFYNALRRLKDALKKVDAEDLLISSKHGQSVNTDLFDCDYYFWQDGKIDDRVFFDGEFLSEYTWGEYILADIVERIHLGLM